MKQNGNWISDKFKVGRWFCGRVCHQKNNVEKIIDNLNYHKVRIVIDVLKENLSNIRDIWDTHYRKLYLILDIYFLQNGLHKQLYHQEIRKSLHVIQCMVDCKLNNMSSIEVTYKNNTSIIKIHKKWGNYSSKNILLQFIFQIFNNKKLDSRTNIAAVKDVLSKPRIEWNNINWSNKLISNHLSKRQSIYYDII